MLHFAPIGVASVVVYIIVAVGIGRRNPISFKTQILNLIFLVYLLAVIAITLFPIPLHRHTGYIQANNLIPFRTITGFLSGNSVANDFRQIGGNILLFAPFGFLLPLVFRTRKYGFAGIVTLGFIATLIVESTQFMLSSVLGVSKRAFDVDDVLCNTFGAFLGYAVQRVSSNLLQNPWRLNSSRIWVIACPILLLLVIGSIWGYEYGSHATPLKAEESYDSNVLPLETIPFDKGVVLIMNTDPSPTEQGYMAWYMTKSDFLGWRLKDKSVELFQEQLKSGMTFKSMSTDDGQTFVWGNSVNDGAREVVYRMDGRSYTSKVDSLRFWHVIIPQSLFSRIGWTVVFQDGRTAQLLN